MRKVLICLLAIVIFIPLSAVSVSAASYELSDPKSYVVFGDGSWIDHFRSIYYYDYDDESVTSPPSPPLGAMALGYYPNGDYSSSSKFDLTSEPYWVFEENMDITFVASQNRIFSNGFNKDLPTLLFCGSTQSGNSGTLFLPGIEYTNLLIPGDGQVLKVSFSVTSVLIGALPSALDSYISPDRLAYIVPTDRELDDNSSPSFPASVTVSANSRTYTYTYYFQLTGEYLSALRAENNVSLVIRFPYWFNSGYAGDVMRVLSNADIPTTYEILTIGGYDQELANIQNAIESSNEKLIDLYTNQTDADKTHVLQFEQSNDELKDSVDEYKEAASAVVSLKQEFTLPPLNDMVDKNFEDIDTFDVKDLFSLPWIVSALGIVFSFTIIRLILYGTKEG